MKRLLAALALLGAAAWAHAVDANTGNRAQLEQLRGIGPPLADAILQARERDGPFRDWGDRRNACAASATPRHVSCPPQD